MTTKIAGFIKCGALAASMVLASAGASAATFQYLYGLDTNSAFDASAQAGTPVEGGDSRTLLWPYDHSLNWYTTTVHAYANAGVVGVMTRVEAERALGSSSSARPEAIATLLGTVNLCAPGSTPAMCIAPSEPVPMPYPNLHYSATIQNGGGVAQLSAIVSVNGNDVGTARDTASASNMGWLNPASVAGMTTSTGVLTIRMSLAAIASCQAAPCVSLVDASNSLGFMEGVPAFLGLADGWTVQSTDFGIVDNLWTDPRVTSVVPVPAALPLVVAGVGLLVGLRRRE
ncbi:MAG: hypothetical protein H6978_02965 [Gammaproteobacteria bacterium]|nr:hypothetical protein [Gammaproteobacteria bacterium]